VSGSHKTIRCAVYTRKSTEHNLDLEFNSLDAQREACEAYIKSQLHEGWRLLSQRYDDGGISGATLVRPDLQRLLADIRAGKVDTVVVYKVDRLTRSLTDFAKLVELFDAHGVSFVSITQAFNTTNSMGRLTLNVLLSFAQFEREVIGERVRDKVAASKRKGLWMGGPAPLGYASQDKKLVVVPEEAETVRWIFRRYLELGSTDRLLDELRQRSIRTKVQNRSDGQTRGGIAFRKGTLVHLLKNRCYAGEIAHRGEIHAAEHAPIVDRETFDAVQARLAANRTARTARLKASPFLLTGRIYDSAGYRMSPVHTGKKGVRYRYYASQALLQANRDQAGQVSRVPAPEIEAAVLGCVRGRFGVWGAPSQDRDLIEAHVWKVTVRAEVLEVVLLDPTAAAGDPSGASQTQTVMLDWVRKPYVAVKGITHAPSEGRQNDLRARDGLLTAIGKARLWVEELVAGGSAATIAKREGKGERQIRLLLPLAFVPPKMVQDLVAGSGPVPTVSDLARKVPLVWPT
jgi:DNA invertase Pin-like site-specific DNA recombinase